MQKPPLNLDIVKEGDCLVIHDFRRMHAKVVAISSAPNSPRLITVTYGDGDSVTYRQVGTSAMEALDGFSPAPLALRHDHPQEGPEAQDAAAAGPGIDGFSALHPLQVSLDGPQSQ